MQKFVIGPCIGGASLPWGAAKYLAFNAGNIDALVGKNPADLTEGYFLVGIGNLKSGILSSWWEHYHEGNTKAKFNELDDDDYVIIDTTDTEFRELLLPYLEALQGKYEELDKANRGDQLRYVEVPDGYCCGIYSDGETGCETVQEHVRMWPAPRDDEFRDILSVRKFCEEAEMFPETHPIQDLYIYGAGAAVLAFKGNYGMARRGNGDVMFLKKHTYFRATDDHGKECFEIVGDKPSKFSVQDVCHSNEEIRAYAELLKFLDEAQGVDTDDIHS